VWGQTLLARSLAVATEIARRDGFDCITLDGDQVSKKGALTGGFIDARRSRMEAHKQIKALTAELDDITKRADSMQLEVESMTDALHVPPLFLSLLLQLNSARFAVLQSWIKKLQASWAKCKSVHCSRVSSKHKSPLQAKISRTIDVGIRSPPQQPKNGYRARLDFLRFSSL
jgi:hypothetical protein